MEIKNFGQFIQYLATKAKVAADNVHLVNLLSNADLTKVSVPEELFKQIDENLLSIDAALDQHPTLKGKYTAEALNPIDKRMQAMIDDLELDDEAKAELVNIKSSYKRFEALTAKIKELGTAKASATGKTDKDALQKQIDNLQSDLRKAKQDVIDKENDYKTQLENDKKDFRLTNSLGGYKTIFDNLPENVRTGTIRSLIDAYLVKNDAELKFDEKGELQPFKKDGSKLYGANHTLTDLKGMIEGVLAENKILQVAAPANGAQQNQQQQQAAPTQIGGGGNGLEKINGTNQTVMDLNSAQIAALEEMK